MGLLDKKAEDKIASEIMQEAGFETAEVLETEPEVQEPAVEEALAEVGILSVDECFGEEEPEDPEFAAAERRMLKATLYRELIKGRFFDGDGDLVSEVETEVKDFVKKQYLLLSGATAAPVVEKDFSPEEITVLKSLAERIVKTPKLLSEPKVAPKAPTVTPKPLPKVAAPVTPPPARKPVEAPRQPRLKQRQVPDDVPQQPAPRPTQKPVQKTKATAPAVPPVVTIPADESIVEEGGQKFKIKYIEMPNIDEFGIVLGGQIRALKNGQATKLSNGIQVVKNGGSVHKILRTAVTNIQQTPGRLPFPSITQMGALTLMQATEAQGHLKPTFDKILAR